MSDKNIFGLTVVVGMILTVILYAAFDLSTPVLFVVGFIIGAIGCMVAYTRSVDTDDD